MKPVQRFHQLVFHKFENEAQFHFFTIEFKKRAIQSAIEFLKEWNLRGNACCFFNENPGWLIEIFRCKRRLCWEVTCSDDEHRLAVGRCRSTTFEGNFFRWKKKTKKKAARKGRRTGWRGWSSSFYVVPRVCLPAVTLHLLLREFHSSASRRRFFSPST